jgi:hypothetical protein
MLSYLVKQHICELFHALFFPHYLLHLSHTRSVHSTTFLVYQPFELEGVMTVSSGVKTQSSNKTVLPVEADLLLGPDSSSKEDSETDDQSYSPPPRCML